MASGGRLNPESDNFENRPTFYIGQHDSNRFEPLTEEQYNQVLNSGVSGSYSNPRILVVPMWLTGHSFAL
jgi:protein arginine N-methyltransferase 5